MAASALRLYGPCALIFLCLLLGPPFSSWLSAVVSPNQIVLDLRGIELSALYKRALRNADGSIDLTINIPNSAHVLEALLDRQEQIKYNMTGMPRSDAAGSVRTITDANHESARRKTYYPITMETPYVLNSPELCVGVDPLHTLVIVHTATGNFQRRRLIRETWAGRHVMKERSLRVAFMLGLTRNATVQLMLENERAVYGDIVQGAFLDSYHNLTHKGVLAYRWIHEHCSQAKLILKVDDDLFINTFLFYQTYYPRYSQAQRTIACHVRPKNTSPISRKKSKWTIQEFEFRGYNYFPFPYCNGYVVFITPDLIKPLFKAAYTTPFFWVDDVYLYGMLPAKIGRVTFKDIHSNMSLSAPRGLQCYLKKKCPLLASGVRTDADHLQLWQLALSQISDDVRKQINPAYLVT